MSFNPYPAAPSIDQRFRPNAAPRFCTITPTAYLNTYARWDNAPRKNYGPELSWDMNARHLALAHLIDKDEQYAKFYHTASTVWGDTIIMDNGAFELGGSYEPSRLIELGKKCGAHALVLPDYPGESASKTIEAAEKYAQQFRDAGFKTMFVPQSKEGDIEDWLAAYRYASSNPLVDIIGMSILGIPNALPSVPRPYARVVMSHILDRQNEVSNKYHHFLGLNAGPNVEIPALMALGILNSCDSSNPVWCGINGLRYNPSQSDWMPISKTLLREVDFDERLSKKDAVADTIVHNLTMTANLFSQKID